MKSKNSKQWRKKWNRGENFFSPRMYLEKYLTVWAASREFRKLVWFALAQSIKLVAQFLTFAAHRVIYYLFNLFSGYLCAFILTRDLKLFLREWVKAYNEPEKRHYIEKTHKNPSTQAQPISRQFLIIPIPWIINRSSMSELPIP